MLNSPFRKEALANRNRRQQLDHLLRVTAPHERIIVAGIGVVLLALAAWVFFGRISTGMTIDGILLKPGDRHAIVALESGQLLAYLVSPGDRIEGGSPIARQSLPDLEREVSALRARIDLLQPETAEAGAPGGSANFASIRETIVQLEARRNARELLISHVGGEVMALGASPGEFLTPGAAVAQVRAADGESLNAFVRVTPRVAQRIEPGMQATVEIELPGDVTEVHGGEIASVTGDPSPDWLDTLVPAAGDSTHLVEIVLDPSSALAMPDGTRCRVRIVFGKYSPIALFNFVRS